MTRSYLELLKGIWAYLKPYQIKFFTAIFFAILMVIGTALYPYIIGLIITEMTKNSMAIMQGVPDAAINYPRIFELLVILGIVFVIEVIGQFVSLFTMASVVQDAMFDLRNDISQKTNRLPVSYFDQNKLGDILSRTTNDVDAVAMALQQSVINGFIALLTIVFAFGMMIFLDWEISLIVVIAIGLSVVSARVVTTISQPYFDSLQNTLGSLFGFTQEQLSGFSEIKAYNYQDQSVEYFKKENAVLTDFGVKSAFWSSVLNPIFTFLFNGSYVLVTLLGGVRVIVGTMTVGSLQAFLTYVTQITQPLNQLSQMIGLVQGALSAAGRIFEYLDAEEEEQDEIVTSLPDKVQGHVVFDHVKFGYSRKNILMNDVSFEVLPGQTVAIVGPTGAGKTTLINLLLRFYDVLDGEIRIDGVNIKDISRAELREHLGMVLQDAWLFSGSVKDNIRFGDIKASDYQVRDAAAVANVDKFIATLPGGYDMEINDEGTNVSQGQKQLMTIARAVISDPDILILDEATSSVDTRLEHLIQTAMDKVMENRTSFVIAHRLSTIRDADIILVMRDGDIIETGNHDTLMAKGGFYADLYNSQFNQNKPADIHLSY